MARVCPSVVRSPTFRHYAPLRAVPTYELSLTLPVCLRCTSPTSLRSSGQGRPPSSSSTHTSGLCVTPRRLRAPWWRDKSQGQRRLRRAGSESTGGRAVSFRLSVAGFSTVVAVAGWVALLAWHLKATRNLPGAQPAAALASQYFACRRLHPRQNPGWGSACQARRAPQPQRDYLRCAQPGYRPWWWVRV